MTNLTHQPAHQTLNLSRSANRFLLRQKPAAITVVVVGNRTDEERIELETERLLGSHPHLAEFWPFLQVLNSESPRGGVLVAASFIEGLLHQILQSFMLDGKAKSQLLTGFNAPIGTFSAKIALAAALGLITDRERRECDLIRKIRNKFAHNVHPTFDDNDVKSLCDELTYRAMPYGIVAVDARGSFTTAAVALILGFTNRPHYIVKERVSAREWPA